MLNLWIQQWKKYPLENSYQFDSCVGHKLSTYVVITIKSDCIDTIIQVIFCCNALVTKLSTYVVVIIKSFTNCINTIIQVIFTDCINTLFKLPSRIVSIRLFKLSSRIVSIPLFKLYGYNYQILHALHQYDY